MPNMVGEDQRYQALGFKKNVQWVFVDNANDVCSDSESMESTIFDEDSTSSLLSSSSSQAMVEELDDASSSTSSASTTSSGPLYELSQLMEHLPIKRGLSNYYQGKSQSFTSLASVKSVEDLAKKENPCKKKVKKPCNRYSPKAIIKKKPCSTSRGSNYFASSLGKNRATFVGTSKYL